MSFVLDCSVAMTWCFKDESTGVTDDLLALVTNGGAYAPLLWPLEVMNVLAVAERRGRITSAGSREWISFFHLLPVVLDTKTAEQAWTVTNALAHRHGLTVYDAAYLELAERLKLPLATLDIDLRKAAKKNGVPLLGI